MDRVIAVYLEGFDFDIARELIKEGLLPELTAMANETLQFEMDQDQLAVRTGLCGEQVATGKSPEQMQSFTITKFDPATYDFCMETTSNPPLSTSISETNISFDLAYYQLEESTNTIGITGWGSHDIGCKVFDRPSTLRAELEEKFGPYKGHDYLYGYVWPFVEKTREMGEKLKAGVEQRTDAVEWLLGERFTDWRLAQIAVSEPHSAIEGLYHGMDPNHPKAHYPSAKVAREGMIGIYTACDALVGRMRQRFPDAKLVVYAMHGMGANDSDVPAMALLPEIMFRREYNKPFLNTEACSTTDPETGLSIPADPDNWERSIRMGMREDNKLQSTYRRYLRWRSRKRRNTHNAAVTDGSLEGGFEEPLDWMPGTLYRPYWPKMRAFCIPSFTDGHIRLNVKGRERSGIVTKEEYSAELDKIRDFIMEIVDPDTGLPIAQDIEISPDRDPMTVGAMQADLTVVWQQAKHVTTFSHPTVGKVGPLPTRRVGGHTGRTGMALIDLRGENSTHGETTHNSDTLGVGLIAGQVVPLRDAFDITPTIFNLAGYEVKNVAGVNLLGNHDVVEAPVKEEVAS